MTNNFRDLCAELLRGLDENRHPEVRYPGHLRLVMASARAELAKADEPDVPAPPANGEVAKLPPRPPLMTPPVHPALERYGITWDGSTDKPLLTRMADGYWTPWHVAAELLERQCLDPLPARAAAVPEAAGWHHQQGIPGQLAG